MFALLAIFHIPWEAHVYRRVHKIIQQALLLCLTYNVLDYDFHKFSYFCMNHNRSVGNDLEENIGTEYYIYRDKVIVPPPTSLKKTISS